MTAMPRRKEKTAAARAILLDFHQQPVTDWLGNRWASKATPPIGAPTLP
jgi:hypothetical protein